MSRAVNEWWQMLELLKLSPGCLQSHDTNLLPIYLWNTHHGQDFDNSVPLPHVPAYEQSKILFGELIGHSIFPEISFLPDCFSPFFGAGYWTQRLTRVRQALDHWSAPQAPVSWFPGCRLVFEIAECSPASRVHTWVLLPKSLTFALLYSTLSFWRADPPSCALIPTSLASSDPPSFLWSHLSYTKCHPPRHSVIKTLHMCHTWLRGNPCYTPRSAHSTEVRRLSGTGHESIKGKDYSQYQTQ